MITSVQTQQIKPTWDLKRVQEAAVTHAAYTIISRLHCIEKHAGKETDERENASAHLKSELMKKRGVKTPMDLVKHIAEFEVNMFGADANIHGDDQNATLVTEKSPVWQEAKKLGNLTKEQETIMQTHYRQWMESLAQAFGFRAQVEVSQDSNSSKITFSNR